MPRRRRRGRADRGLLNPGPEPVMALTESPNLVRRRTHINGLRYTADPGQRTGRPADQWIPIIMTKGLIFIRFDDKR